MHREIHLRPWEIRAMTVPEVLLALDGDLEKPRAPEGGVPVTPDYVRWWRSLTVRERFEIARRKWSP